LSGLIGISILVAMVYVLVAAGITGNRGKRESMMPESSIVLVDSLGPSGGVEAAPAAATSGSMAVGAGEAPGLAIYNKSCMVCHDAGVAGAPRLGDKADWEPRVAQGYDRFLQVVIAGMGVMPPRGSCMDCGDEELEAAIRYMLAQVGYATAPPARAGDARSAEAAPATEGLTRMQNATSGGSTPVLN
jgi:cytochrome c5